jgi:hypothetical protein
MRGWNQCHLELTLRTSQALEIVRIKGLHKENVSSFYENLEALCSMFMYSPNCM